MLEPLIVTKGAERRMAPTHDNGEHLALRYLISFEELSRRPLTASIQSRLRLEYTVCHYVGQLSDVGRKSSSCNTNYLKVASKSLGNIVGYKSIAGCLLLAVSQDIKFSYHFPRRSLTNDWASTE